VDLLGEVLGERDSSKPSRDDPGEGERVTLWDFFHRGNQL
jgi:hypothetical protein